ncbi:uncharacterized protein LOC120328747 isoform X1 [Styela clava]
MNRRTSNMYARFNDIFEEPDDLPTAVFSSDGKIEFVNIDDEVKFEPKPELPPDRTEPEKKPRIKPSPKRIKLSRKALIFTVFAIIMFIIFIFTVASFILMLQNRSELHSSKKQNTTELTDSKVNALLPIWLNRTVSKIQDQYEISSNELDEKIEAALMNLSEKAVARIRGITTTTVPATSIVRKRLCSIEYGDKCYWATKSKRIQYDKAAELCHGHGAEAANIYGEEHFQIIVKYLRDVMQPWKTVWLGMTRDAQAGITYLRNGTISNYTMDWYPGYPVNKTSWSQIGIHFEKDTNASHQGFFNDYPTGYRHGILCEM